MRDEVVHIERKVEPHAARQSSERDACVQRCRMRLPEHVRTSEPHKRTLEQERGFVRMNSSCDAGLLRNMCTARHLKEVEKSSRRLARAVSVTESSIAKDFSPLTCTPFVGSGEEQLQ